MSVGGNDDTLASTVPALDGAYSAVTEAEVVAGRYRLVRWLGSGGMGRVYEAIDTELDERVALKVLRSGLSDDAIERFRREVKLTRRIQHRNVARMFDIGEHKGEKFLTMELVDGEPLTRLIGETAMPWPRLKAIAEQICAGLTAAHTAGVIHRDLKPDNVLIERGTDRAVLTDFGIARGGDDPSVTKVGALVGTPRYMSPEQLACRELDSRADLFSLGVILFELATGTRPWAGDNAIVIAVSQATTAPRTIETTNGAVPPYFAALVAACIEIDPAGRPASAAEIAATLASGKLAITAPDKRTRTPTRPPLAPLSAAESSSEPTSLAVLPLACTAGDEYLADGILEDLTDTLSTTPGLRVRPAGLVRQTAVPDPREVGQRLNVDHVVTASLRRTPRGLRIATRLLSVADGFQIWAHRTDCSDADVLTVADELARGIATALSTRTRAAAKPTDPRAVELYLRARAELRQFWGAHVQAAADLLEQAVEYAPTSGPILGAYAYVCVQSWVMRSEPTLIARARAAVQRGLASGHGEAFLAAAQLHFNQRDPERGAAELARALIRAPMSGPTHELAGKILLEIDGPTAARQHFETARGLDPARAHVIDSDLARADALAQKWDDADARTASITAHSEQPIRQMGVILAWRLATWRGRRDSAVDAARPYLAQFKGSTTSILKVVFDLQDAGGLDEAVWQGALAQQGDPDEPGRQFLMRFQIFCEVALFVGDTHKALDALERAVDLGFMDITWMENCPLVSRVANDPRYLALRRQVADRASRVLAAFRSTNTLS